MIDPTKIIIADSVTICQLKERLKEAIELLKRSKVSLDKAFEYDDGDVFGFHHNQASDDLNDIENFLKKHS